MPHSDTVLHPLKPSCGRVDLWSQVSRSEVTVPPSEVEVPPCWVMVAPPPKLPCRPLRSYCPFPNFCRLLKSMCCLPELSLQSRPNVPPTGWAISPFEHSSQSTYVSTALWKQRGPCLLPTGIMPHSADFTALTDRSLHVSCSFIKARFTPLSKPRKKKLHL